MNGLKREYDDFDESSDAATPMSVSDDQAAKRIKVEREQGSAAAAKVPVKTEEGRMPNGGGEAKRVVPVKKEESDDDDDDEMEFEDA